MMHESRCENHFRKHFPAMSIRKEEVVVIGDQLMTDILGGNRRGLHTILVVPVAQFRRSYHEIQQED